jgi:hypothetical protein
MFKAIYGRWRAQKVGEPKDRSVPPLCLGLGGQDGSPYRRNLPGPTLMEMPLLIIIFGGLDVTQMSQSQRVQEKSLS